MYRDLLKGLLFSFPYIDSYCYGHSLAFTLILSFFFHFEYFWIKQRKHNSNYRLSKLQMIYRNKSVSGYLLKILSLVPWGYKDEENPILNWKHGLWNHFIDYGTQTVESHPNLLHAFYENQHIIGQKDFFFPVLWWLVKFFFTGVTFPK